MRYIKLLYNSFLWGLTAAILAFQNQWLEMRMNIGYIIPIVMVGAFAILAAAELRIRKKVSFGMSSRFTIINILICTITSILTLGLERIKVVPAVILREGIGMTRLSFGRVNTVLVIALVIGLGAVLLEDRLKPSNK